MPEPPERSVDGYTLNAAGVETAIWIFKFYVLDKAAQRFVIASLQGAVRRTEEAIRRTEEAIRRTEEEAGGD